MCISIGVCVCVSQVIGYIHWVERASQVVLVVKNPPTKAGDIRDARSIPRWGRFPGKGNGNPLVFLPGESHEQMKPGRLQSIGLQRVWCDWSNLTYTGLNSVPPNSCPGFCDGSNSKESACSVGDPGSIPGLGRSPAEGNGNPLQYSGLENSMDRGVWWSIVHGVAKSWTQLSN